MRKTLTDCIQAEFRNLRAQAEVLHRQIETRSWGSFYPQTPQKTPPAPMVGITLCSGRARWPVWITREIVKKKKRRSWMKQNLRLFYKSMFWRNIANVDSMMQITRLMIILCVGSRCLCRGLRIICAPCLPLRSLDFYEPELPSSNLTCASIRPPFIYSFNVKSLGSYD